LQEICIQDFPHNILLISKGSDMRLADFIFRDMETILAAWEAFASVQMPAAKHMKSLALRDHARQILDGAASAPSTRTACTPALNGASRPSMGIAPYDATMSCRALAAAPMAEMPYARSRSSSACPTPPFAEFTSAYWPA
jgi:hypothetical protein